MHYRQRIRDALSNALIGRTLAAQNVFTSRARPVLEIVQRREAVLSIYTADERSERDGTGTLLSRTLTVTIEGMLGGGDDVDDRLDYLALTVEAVIDADPSLGGLLSEDLVLQSTASEITARGNAQIGAFRLDYDCAYLTERIAEVPVVGFPPSDVVINPEITLDALIPANAIPAGSVDVAIDQNIQNGPLDASLPCACDYMPEGGEVTPPPPVLAVWDGGAVWDSNLVWGQ